MTSALTTKALCTALLAEDNPYRIGQYAGEVVMYDLNHRYVYCSPRPILTDFYLAPTPRKQRSPLIEDYPGLRSTIGERCSYLTDTDLDRCYDSTMISGLDVSAIDAVQNARPFNAAEVGWMRRNLSATWGRPAAVEHHPDPLIALWRYLWTNPTSKVRQMWRKEFLDGA